MDPLLKELIDWNLRFGPLNGGKKFEPVGGGVGTVSAAGGWLQGGGLSTGLGSLQARTFTIT